MWPSLTGVTVSVDVLTSSTWICMLSGHDVYTFNLVRKGERSKYEIRFVIALNKGLS